jgi:tetratricopeptide (TPR) repeat protein
MLDSAILAISGTFAWNVIKKSGSYLFDTVGDEVIGSHGDKYFCQIVVNIISKLKTNSPPENHELVKAFRRACIMGTQHICASRKMALGKENSPSIIRRLRTILLGDTPTSLSAQNEKQWLDRVQPWLQKQIDGLNQGIVYLPNRSNESYQMLIVPKGVSSATRADEFRQILIKDALAELTEVVEAPPHTFSEEMETAWFNLVCNEFQDAISRNQLLSNQFQNQTLVEIKSETNEIKFTIHEVLSLLRENVNKKNQTEETVVFNLPNLNEKVYARETEAAKVLHALCKAEKQFFLVVAPSGFGKTFLLIKVLQTVTDGIDILPNYQDKVQRIIAIDCRLKKNLTQIISDFGELFKAKLDYAPTSDETIKEWLSKHLFPLIAISGTTWLILDNFESWLDSTNNYKAKEFGIQVFLNALFDGNHNLKVLIFSQTEPNADVTINLEKLETVSNSISNGLPELEAIDFLRTEGKSVGLDKADEKDLKDFLKRICYIPQAMSSLIGYMKTNQTEWELRGYTFSNFMSDHKLWAKFDEYEHKSLPDETDLQNKAMRRTKALIARQIQAQSGEIKLLMATLSFFSQPVPIRVLEVICKIKEFSSESIFRLIDHRLTTVRKERGDTLFELHAYFREQTSKHKFLSLFKSLPKEHLAALGHVLLHIDGPNKRQTSQYKSALIYYDCAEQLYRFLFLQKKYVDADKNLAVVYINKSIVLGRLGELGEAINELDKAIEVFKQALHKDKRDEIIANLASAHSNKGTALYNLGKLNEALAEHNNAIKVLERFVVKKSEVRLDIADQLGSYYVNKGSVLTDLDRASEALVEYEKAINFREWLVKDEKHEELEDSLARAYWGKGYALRKMDKFSQAIVEFDKAIEIIERLIHQNNREELINDLATIYKTKAAALFFISDSSQAASFFDKANVLLIRCLKEKEWIHVLPDLMDNLKYNNANLLMLKNWERAGQNAALAYQVRRDYIDAQELSEFFKKQTEKHFIELISLLRDVPAKDRKKIYHSAGIEGKSLRQLVED